MKKSFAWTLAEMVIAITVIVVLTGVCLNAFKPKTQNSRLYVFATVRNLMRANSILLQDNKKNLEEYTDYCNQLADLFTLKSSSCSGTGGLLTFVNGSTVNIKSTSWQTDGDYKYLDILIDVDGEKDDGGNNIGKNAEWIDQFPMRIYSAPGYDGVVFPKDTYVTDNTIISYDVFRTNTFVDYDADDSQSEEMAAATVMVAGNLSPMEADCAAYGGRGFFSASDCNKSDLKRADGTTGVYQLHKMCATEETCEACSAGLCDKATCINTWRANNNPDDLPCYTLMHKPNAGMSFIVESVIGEIDTDY